MDLVTVVSCAKESLLIAFLYLLIVWLDRDNRLKLKKIGYRDLCMFVVVYTLVVLVLVQMNSPLYINVLSYAGVLLGNKMFGILT